MQICAPRPSPCFLVHRSLRNIALKVPSSASPNYIPAGDPRGLLCGRHVVPPLVRTLPPGAAAGWGSPGARCDHSVSPSIHRAAPPDSQRNHGGGTSPCHDLTSFTKFFTDGNGCCFYILLWYRPAIGVLLHSEPLVCA